MKPRRKQLPPRSVWAFMASLYSVASLGIGTEGALAELLGALTDEYVSGASRGMD